MKKYLIFLIALCAPLAAKEGDAPKNTCHAYFGENNELIENLLTLIQDEQEGIQIAASRLSNRRIVKALIGAKKRGINVEVILERMSNKLTSSVNEIIRAGIPVYVYQSIEKNPKKNYTQTKLREKFCLFKKNKNNENHVWTGSLDFVHRPKKGTRENVLLLSGAEVMQKYENEFLELKESHSIGYEEFQKKSNHRTST